MAPGVGGAGVFTVSTELLKFVETVKNSCLFIAARILTFEKVFLASCFELTYFRQPTCLYPIAKRLKEEGVETVKVSSENVTNQTWATPIAGRLWHGNTTRPRRQDNFSPHVTLHIPSSPI